MSHRLLVDRSLLPLDCVQPMVAFQRKLAEGNGTLHAIRQERVAVY